MSSTLFGKWTEIELRVRNCGFRIAEFDNSAIRIQHSALNVGL